MDFIVAPRSTEGLSQSPCRALPIKGLDRSDADDANLWDGLGELVVLPSLKDCSYHTHSAAGETAPALQLRTSPPPAPFQQLQPQGSRKYKKTKRPATATVGAPAADKKERISKKQGAKTGAKKGSKGMGKTSKFVGVSWHTGNKGFRANVQFNNKPQHLGYFKNEEQAARRYDELVIALRGPDAPTNFPRSTYPGKAALFKKWSSFIKEKIRKDAARGDSKQAPRKRQRGDVPPEPAISAAGRPVTGGLVLERAPRSPPRDPSAVARRSLRPRRAAALKRSRYSFEDGSDSEEGSVGQCRAVRQRLGF